ncbi:hypothetical protein A9299_10060 [Moraxella osloensis]|uniref:Large polyvalent protein-associated domain-containing protein n=1 Tax=Faucicola osloensis TaxID=34062 RepID=A0AA91FIU0_FAUOS|nr:LPD7 domain-containing protein [Moraxella osloensis]OBX64341.1 hypothetical protein A9299_10060 [Moraxella osloensis]
MAKNVVTHGELLEHGQAPYQFNEQNNTSYFAKVRTEEGRERTLWGVGIQGAIEQSQVEVGDNVTLINRGEQAISVPDPKNAGQYINTKKNLWEAEIYEAPIEKNSIEPILEREIEALPLAKNLTNGEVEVEDEELQTPVSRKPIPQNIENNYIAIQKNRFLKDAKINYYDKEDYQKGEKGIAFEDRNKSLNTARNDERTVKAMLDLAQSKGWSAISIKGEQEFKRQMWIEANLRGMETRGYTPTEQDKADLQIRQEGRTTNEISNNVERSLELNAEAERKARENASEAPIIAPTASEVTSTTLDTPEASEAPTIVSEAPTLTLAEQYRNIEGVNQDITDMELQDIEARMYQEAKRIIEEVTANYTPEDVTNMAQMGYQDEVQRYIVERELELYKDTPEYQSANKALFDATANSGHSWATDAGKEELDNRLKEAIINDGEIEKNRVFVEAQNTINNIAQKMPEADALRMQHNYQNSLAGREVELSPDQKAINDISKAMMIEEEKAREIYSNPDFEMPDRESIKAEMDFSEHDNIEEAIDIKYQNQIRYSVADLDALQTERMEASNIELQEQNQLSNVEHEANKDFKLEAHEGRFTIQNLEAGQVDFGDNEKYSQGVHIRDNDTGENYAIATYEIEYMGNQSVGVAVQQYANDVDYTNKEIANNYDRQVFAKLGMTEEMKEVNAVLSGEKDMSIKELNEALSKENLQNAIKTEASLAPEMKIAYESAEKAGFDKKELNELTNSMLQKYDTVWDRSDRNEKLEMSVSSVTDINISDEKNNKFVDNFSEKTKLDFSYMKVDEVQKSDQQLATSQVQKPITIEPEITYATSEDNRYTMIALNENQVNEAYREQFVNGVLIKDNDTGERYKMLNLSDNVQGFDKNIPLEKVPDGEIYSIAEYYVDDKELMTDSSQYLVEDNRMALNKLGISDKSNDEKLKQFAQNFSENGKSRPNNAVEVVNALKIENLREVVGKEQVRMPMDLKLAVEASKDAGFDQRQQALLVTRNLDNHSDYRLHVNSREPEAKQLRVELIADDLVRNCPKEDREKLNQFVDKYAEKTGYSLEENRQDIQKWAEKDKEEDKSKEEVKLVVSHGGDTERATLERPTQTEVIERNEQLFEDASKSLGDREASNLHAMRQIVHATYANQPDKLDACLKQLDEATKAVAKGDIQLPEKNFVTKEAPEVTYNEPQTQNNRDRSL